MANRQNATLSNLGLVVDRIGTAKANPNHEKNNLIIWYGISLVLVFFITNALINSLLLDLVTWIIGFISTKYINQLILFLAVMVINIAIVFVTRNTNAVNGGFLAVITYYALDYFVLSTIETLAEFSLLANM